MDNFNNLDMKTKVCCISVTASIFLISILAIISFGAVEPTEYGILYNSITKDLNTDYIYEGGLQYIGIFHKLITFPAIHQTIEFSNVRDATATELKTRT